MVDGTRQRPTQYKDDSSAVSKETLSGAQSETKTYAYDALGNAITLSDATGGTTNRYSYLYDPRSSVSMLLDSSGAAKESYGYSAYGSKNASISKSASGFSTGSVPTNPVRFQGKRFDSGSGSYDMGARRYSATTGRWLSQDIYYGALDNLGLSQDPLTANRYAFLGANPINYVEADGHSSAWDSFTHTLGNFGRGMWDGTRQLAGAAVCTEPGIGTYCQARAAISFVQHPIASLKAMPHTIARSWEQENKKHGFAGVQGYEVPFALGVLATRGDSAFGEAAGAETEAGAESASSRLLPKEYYESKQEPAPVNGAPYGRHEQSYPNGDLKQVTTYDEFGRRAHQYEFGSQTRHGEGQHDFEYSGRYPSGVRSGHKSWG